jgi:hypothetical protein
LKDYKKIITYWEDQKRQEFSGLKIIVRDTTLNNEALLVQQQQDPSMISQDHYSKIQTYTPLFYSISLLNSNKVNQTELLELTLSILDGDQTSNITLPKLHAFKTSEVSVLRGACKSLGGSYKSFASCKLKLVKSI